MATPEQSVPICRYCGPTCEVGFGYCHCKCGNKARISGHNNRTYDHKKGEPRKFLWGHCRKINPIPEDAVPFKLSGKPCRLIALTQGKYAIVAEPDYLRFMERKWYARWDKQIRGYYAVRHTPTINGKSSQIYMHREVVGLKHGDPAEVDHKDRYSTLDNRPDNLRLATTSENGMNQKKKKNNSSGRKGVYFLKSREKWVAEIGYGGKTKYLGEHHTFEAACLVRREAENIYHGEFARAE